MRPAVLASGLATTLLVWPSIDVAAELPAVAYACVTCHGQEGANDWPDVPNIGGLSGVLIYNALWDFREQARPCREPACEEQGACPDLDMCQVAKPLADDQLELLAATFSAFEFQPVAGDYDPGLAARGREIHSRECEMCHAEGGTSSLEGAAILRGQKMAYLRTALEDFRHGRRPVLDAMMERIEDLDDAQAEALVHFYASPPEGLRRER